MKKTLIVLTIAAFLITVIYIVFLTTRKISYEIFYEDLVQETVQDMVKSESLKEHYEK